MTTRLFSFDSITASLRPFKSSDFHLWQRVGNGTRQRSCSLFVEYQVVADISTKEDLAKYLQEKQEVSTPLLLVFSESVSATELTIFVSLAGVYAIFTFIKLVTEPPC